MRETQQRAIFLFQIDCLWIIIFFFKFTQIMTQILKFHKFSIDSKGFIFFKIHTNLHTNSLSNSSTFNLSMDVEKDCIYTDHFPYDHGRKSNKKVIEIKNARSILTASCSWMSLLSSTRSAFSVENGIYLESYHRPHGIQSQSAIGNGSALLFGLIFIRLVFTVWILSNPRIAQIDPNCESHWPESGSSIAATARCQRRLM